MNHLRLKTNPVDVQPPKGYVDFYVLSGSLVMEDSDGVVSEVGAGLSFAEIETQLLANATSTSVADSLLRTTGNGTLAQVHVSGALIAGLPGLTEGSLQISNGDGGTFTLTSNGAADVTATTPSATATGTVLALVPSYLDATAAANDTDSNVVYFNRTTGQFMVVP